jgi:hypothetical protein
MATGGRAGGGITAVALTKLSAFAGVTLCRHLAQTLAGRELAGIRKIFQKISSKVLTARERLVILVMFNT